MISDIENGHTFLRYCYRNEIHAAGLLRRNGADLSTLRPRLIKERGALCWWHLRFLLNDWYEISL
jgi:hypothetical protein